jgi:hypothetical protein
MPSSQRTPFRYQALLCLPALAYLLLTAYWRHRDADPLTGDETYYLFTTESIVDDFDVDVKNNLQKFGFRSADLQESQSIEGSHGWFSVHNLGLSALVAVPWAVRGAWGARLTMALCCGLAAPVLYRAIHHIWPCTRNSFLLALSLALGLPLLQACNQIYPDLLAGILLLFAADEALSRQPPATSMRWRDLFYPATLAFLPWLHIKYVAPAVIVWAWHADTTRQRRSLVVGAAFGGSLALLAIYNAYAFGKMTGPYAGDGLVLHRNSLIVFLGLHFDQAQGMFLQQPLWLLGVVGLAPMWHSSRRSCLWWLLLYASTIVPNAMHPNWYGGYSYLGRFGATSVLLWAIPLAYGARMLFGEGTTGFFSEGLWRQQSRVGQASGTSAGPPCRLWWAGARKLACPTLQLLKTSFRQSVAPAVVALLSLALQGWLASHWLRADRLQFGCLFPESVANCHSMYPLSLKPYLPYWLPDGDVWRCPANVVAMVVAAGALACGMLWQGRLKGRAEADVRRVQEGVCATWR